MHKCSKPWRAASSILCGNSWLNPDLLFWMFSKREKKRLISFGFVIFCLQAATVTTAAAWFVQLWLAGWLQLMLASYQINVSSWIPLKLGPIKTGPDWNQHRGSLRQMCSLCLDMLRNSKRCWSDWPLPELSCWWFYGEAHHLTAQNITLHWCLFVLAKHLINHWTDFNWK